MSRDVRARVVEAVALVVVVVVAGLAFAWHFDGLPRRATGDSYYYLTSALEFTGMPTEQAQARAGEVVCGEQQRLHRRQPSANDCVRYVVRPPARYVAIFSSRPGWPMVVSPFAALFGVWWGAVVVALAFAVLAAVLVHASLRLVAGPVGGAAGGVLFSLLPTGTWASWLLPEGAVLAGTALALLAATLLLQDSRHGPPLLLIAVVFTYLCKPANGAAVSAALLAAGLLLTMWPGRRLHGVTLAASGALGLAGWQAISNALGLSSLDDTLQDLATRHFKLPDVPDPYTVLGQYEHDLWTFQVDRWLGLPEPLVMVLAGCVLAVAGLRRAGVIWSMVALSALGIIVLHPLVSQYDRLGSPLWLAVCAGAAGAVRLAGRLLPAGWRDLSTSADPGGREDQGQLTATVGAPQEDV